MVNKVNCNYGFDFKGVEVDPNPLLLLVKEPNDIDQNKLTLKGIV